MLSGSCLSGFEDTPAYRQEGLGSLGFLLFECLNGVKKFLV
jgi:hypothetical protein